jgi:hypothetical protein
MFCRIAKVFCFIALLAFMLVSGGAIAGEWIKDSNT